MTDIHCCEAKLNYYTESYLFEPLTYIYIYIFIYLFMVDFSEDENLDFAQYMDTVNQCP